MKEEADNNFEAGLKKILLFFENTRKWGLLFATFPDFSFRASANETLITRCAGKNIRIENYNFVLDDELMSTFIFRLREMIAERKPDGIVFLNLEEAILHAGTDLTEAINMAREMFFEMDLPFLFWIKKETVAVFANHASDIYLRRDMSNVYFEGTEKKQSEEKLERLKEEKAPAAPIDKGFLLRISIFEKQLKEAEERKEPPERIIDEIVIPLLEQYVRAEMKEQASKLFEHYKGYFSDKNPFHQHIVAYIYAETGKTEEAKIHYEITLAFEPNNPIAHYNYAILLRNTNDFGGAKKHYEKALEITPNYAIAHCNYAHLLEENFHDFAKAKKHYEKALELNPNDALAQNNYALLLKENFNDFAEAKKHYQKALQINPNFDGAHYNYAILLKNNFNQHEEALKHYLKAIEIDPFKKTPESDKLFGNE